MKALSLKQPFAELILQGRKKIELRKWNTKFRGKFLIHASKQTDKTAMEKFGFSSLPTDCIVGKARLVDVKKYENEAEFNKDKDLHLASSEWGKYGFILDSVKRVQPIPSKGSLNFWNFNGKIELL